ncbi:MAG: hypothetical protein WBA45_01820 [Microthrixaceae bacterium]
MSVDIPVKRSTEWWELSAAVLLSLATVLSAWSGYQSSRWNGHASTLNREASEVRSRSTRAASAADQQLVIDVALFTDWVSAHLAGDEVRSAFIRDRFRAEFVPAFNDWAKGIGSAGYELPDETPFASGMFTSAAQKESDRLLELAEEHQIKADEATRTAEDFVLTAVLFASVLFFAGIGSKLSSPQTSHLAVALSGLSLLGALVVLAMQPIQLGY